MIRLLARLFLAINNVAQQAYIGSIADGTVLFSVKATDADQLTCMLVQLRRRHILDVEIVLSTLQLADNTEHLFGCPLLVASSGWSQLYSV